MNRRAIGIGVFGLVIWVAGAGCSAKPDPGLLDRAQKLGTQYRWQEAQPLIKEYLAFYPQDPYAHYLLGRTFLHLANPFLVLAEGEFQTALYWYEKTGSSGGLAATLGGPQFAASVYRELARIHLRIIYEISGNGSTGPILQMHVKAALNYLDKGLALDPGAVPLLEMKKALESNRFNQSPVRPAPRNDLTV